MKGVTGNTWNEIVENPTKDVLVLFMSPKSTQGSNAHKTFESLARQYKDNQFLDFVEMDCLVNEVKDFVPPSYPYVKLYPMNNKSGIDFREGSDKIDVKNIDLFLA